MSPRLFLLVLCALLIVGLPVTAQSDNVLPPRVTSIQPLEGVPLTVDDTLTLTFNQPMQAATLTFAPEVAGSIAWPNPLTLEFTPVEKWPIGVDYTATLHATSESGIDLAEPVIFEQLGPPPLTITTVSPTPDTNDVTAHTDLLIGFDRPMISLDGVGDEVDNPAQMPFTLWAGDDMVFGTGEWLTSSLFTFVPEEELPGGVVFTARVSENLAAVNGTLLAEAFSWSFTTILPNVLEVQAIHERTGVLEPESDIYVLFNQAMDRASTETVVVLKRRNLYPPEGDNIPAAAEIVPVRYWWYENYHVLTLNPREILAPGYTYWLEFTGDTQSASGARATLGSSRIGLGEIIFEPLRISPANGEVMRPGMRKVSFHFGMPMNSESFRDHFRIEPEPPGPVIPAMSYEDYTFSLTFEHVDETTYTVTLLPGIEDKWDHVWPIEISTRYHVRTAGSNSFGNSVSLGLSDNFVTIPSYQTPPAFDLDIEGQPTVEFSLYRADVEQVVRSDNQFYPSRYYGSGFYTRPYSLPEGDPWEPDVPWVTDENLLHSWIQSFSYTDDIFGYVPLTLAEGEPLPLGLYGIELFSPAVAGYNGRNGVLLSVANVGITVKAGADGDSAIWVTDLKTGVPVPGATVTVYERDGSQAASGITDAEGVFLVPRGPFDSGGSLAVPTDFWSLLAGGYNYYHQGRFSGINFIKVTGDNLYGAWHNGNVHGAPATTSYLYTDRPIYRPGETVYFRGVLRDRLDMTYTMPPDVSAAHVRVGRWEDYYRNRQFVGVFHETDLTVTDFGTVSGSFVLPRDLALTGPYSPYTIRITACPDDVGDQCAIYSAEIDFEVAEFRVPEFEVTVTSNRDDVIAGEPLEVDVRAAYYSGGVVSEGRLSWTVGRGYSWRNRFDYQGEERGYIFGGGGYGRYYEADDGSGRLDELGQYHITPTVEKDYSTFGPGSLTVEASVRDESGHTISGTSERITVHPAAVYIGMRTPDRFQPTEAPFDVDILTITPQSAIVSQQPVTLEVTELRWVRTEGNHVFANYDLVRVPVSTTTIATDANGYATYQFIAPNAGRFEIVAHTEDSEGREAQTRLMVYAENRYTTNTRIWWTGQDWYYEWDYFYRGEPRVDLLANETQFRPGDTAEVLIPNPFDEPVEVLVTVERAGVISHDAVHIEGDALVYTFDVTDEHAPGIWVSIVMIRGATEDEPDPVYRFGRIELDVEPTARRLNIELTPSAAELAPRDELTFDVRVTDADGNPVQAEIGLHLTDDAVLALRPSNSESLEQRFYSDTRLRVFATTSHMSLLSTRNPMGPPDFGGAGEPGPAGVLVRDDFVYTPLWAPHVVTNEDGHATVSVTLPDNLTRWRLDARAVTLDTNIGQAQTTVTSTLPLIVRPDVPRYFIVGDQLPISGIVNNHTAEPQTVNVTLDSTGLTLLADVPLMQTVEIAPFGRAVIEWPVIVEDVLGVDLTIYAEATSGLADAAKPTLRTGPEDTVIVHRYTAPETLATAGVLDEAGRAQEGLLLPAGIAPVSGELTVQLDSSLAAPIFDGLGYLRDYPHFCNEQTVSRFYPNLMTSQLLVDFGTTDTDLVTNLQENIDPALAKLIAEQNTDGGWGWFSGMRSHPYLTAYVLLALAEANDAGYAVPHETLASATDYLSAYLDEFDTGPTTHHYEFNRAAFTIYALARAGTFPQAAYDELLPYRERLGISALAHLALAAETSGNDAQVLQLVNDLTTRARSVGTRTYWTERRDWYNWGTNTRTTATVVLALTRLQPDHPLLPGAIRWLMTARSADHWPTTQETAWTILALGEWLRTTGELSGDYVYQLTLNGVALAEGDVTPAEIRATQGTEAQLRVEVSDLLADVVNLLDISRSTGPGALYYLADLQVEYPADEVEPLSRGISVQRTYRDPDRTWVKLDEVVEGEQVLVRLNFTLEQDMHYVVLEDFLPAGLEVLDTNLLTTSRTVDTPGVRRHGSYWYYRNYFDRIELRDTGAVLYADYLRRGSYTFTYLVQATQPGTFQAIPAHGYAFYTPEIFGRTAGALFTVTPE